MMSFAQAPEIGLLAPDLVLYLDISPEVSNFGCTLYLHCITLNFLLISNLHIGILYVSVKIFVQVTGLFFVVSNYLWRVNLHGVFTYVHGMWLISLILFTCFCRCNIVEKTRILEPLHHYWLYQSYCTFISYSFDLYPFEHLVCQLCSLVWYEWHNCRIY